MTSEQIQVRLNSCTTAKEVAIIVNSLMDFYDDNHIPLYKQWTFIGIALDRWAYQYKGE